MDHHRDREKLKPCPFCGADPEGGGAHLHDEDCYVNFLIQQANDPASTRHCDFEAAWNRRVDVPCDAAQVLPAWAVYNGVCLDQVFILKESADKYADNMQKSHDLSGLLAAFVVKPLYAAPIAPASIDLTDAYAGAREDLEIWKRRALEAEEKLRDSINKPCLEAKSTVSIRTYVASQIDIPYDVAVDRVREGWTDYKNSRFHPGAEEVAKKRASLRILEADALIALLGDS